MTAVKHYNNQPSCYWTLGANGTLLYVRTPSCCKQPQAKDMPGKTEVGAVYA